MWCVVCGAFYEGSSGNVHNCTYGQDVQCVFKGVEYLGFGMISNVISIFATVSL